MGQRVKLDVLLIVLIYFYRLKYKLEDEIDPRKYRVSLRCLLKYRTIYFFLI